MRTIIIFSLILFSLSGCFLDKKSTPSLLLSSDKDSILADNLDTVIFSVKNSDKISIFINNKPSETHFSTSVSGRYVVYASNGTSKSNTLIITAKNGVSVSSGCGLNIINKNIELIIDTSSAAIKRTPAVFNYTILHTAQVSPVSLYGADGTTTVQADHIVISGNRAYISYNYRGEEFKGAIQIIDITKPTIPEIIKEIRFTDKDINCLYYDGNALLFGGGADPDTNPAISFVASLDISNETSISAAAIKYLYFPESYGVTAITRQGNIYYAGVGAKNGGIISFDKTMIRSSPSAIIAAPDIRDISSYKEGIIALEGTTDNTNTSGNIIQIDNNLNITKNPILDFKSPYNKSTLEIYNNNILLLGLSDGGFKAYDLNYLLSPFFTLDNPDTNPKHVTNGVSYDSNLLFSANGEYGFRVISISNPSDKSSQFGNLVGFYPFENNPDTVINETLFSANYIAYKSGSLFVASGVGGVNIYTLTKK